MTLLISDTNIFIDLEEGELIEELFRLPGTIGVPDILYVDELQEQHAHLLGRGLKILELSMETVLRVSTLGAKYTQPSRLDLAALATAEQEGCPLVTGDRNLRRAAEKEGLQVYGTLWLCEKLVTHDIISVVQLEAAYQRMLANGRRLPEGAIATQLARLRQP